MCLIIKIRKCVVSNYTYMSNFHPLEVVGRGSETQLQVSENLNKGIHCKMTLVLLNPYIYGLKQIFKPNKM